MSEDTCSERIDRRTLLKTGTVLASGLLATGTASATTEPDQRERHEGESVAVGDGTVLAYATTGSGGELASLGTHVDGDAMDAFGDEPVAAHLQLPEETTDGEALDLGRFTFVGFHFNPEGHPPEGVYTVPHFDFHFYMLDERTVEGIEEGPATYSIPERQVAEDYTRPPLVDTDDDGEPDAPLVEPEMGEHLLDPTAPEFQEDGVFTHTNIYGAYDANDDGVGRLTFVEPMITVDVFDRLEEETVVELKTPAEYYEAGEYPTTYAMDPDGDGGAYVTVGDFAAFPGPGE